MSTGCRLSRTLERIANKRRSRRSSGPRWRSRAGDFAARWIYSPLYPFALCASVGLGPSDSTSFPAERRWSDAKTFFAATRSLDRASPISTTRLTFASERLRSRNRDARRPEEFANERRARRGESDSMGVRSSANLSQESRTSLLSNINSLTT